MSMERARNNYAFIGSQNLHQGVLACGCLKKKRPHKDETL